MPSTSKANSKKLRGHIGLGCLSVCLSIMRYTRSITVSDRILKNIWNVHKKAVPYLFLSSRTCHCRGMPFFDPFSTFAL